MRRNRNIKQGDIPLKTAVISPSSQHFITLSQFFKFSTFNLPIYFCVIKLCIKVLSYITFIHIISDNNFIPFSICSILVFP